MDITIKAIEALTRHEDPTKRCASITSVAEGLGCSRQFLWEWLVREECRELIEPGGIDHGVIRRYIARGARIPSDIARGISSRNHTVAAGEVADYMHAHGLVFPNQQGHGDRFRKIQKVNLPTIINHAGKEFPRGSTEIRRCRTLRENRLAQLRHA
jgi:hypothetical protein